MMAAVQVILELGHRATVREHQTAEGYTHDWVVFVRGHNRESIDSFIEKIVFQLHASFPRPKRAKHSPPYEVRESGYAGFLLPIIIYFKNRESLRFHHDLVMRNNEPTQHVRQEKLTFPNPTDEFRRLLMRAGGVSVSHNELASPRHNIHRSSTSHAGGKTNSPPSTSSAARASAPPSSSSSHARVSDKRGTSTGKTTAHAPTSASSQHRASKNSAEKKSSKTDVNPSQKEFLTLFGTPIKKSSHNSENSKTGHSASSTDKSGQDSSKKKASSKDSPTGSGKDKKKSKHSTVVGSTGRDPVKKTKTDDRSDKTGRKSNEKSECAASEQSSSKSSSSRSDHADKHGSSRKSEKSDEKSSSKSNKRDKVTATSDKMSREAVKLERTTPTDSSQSSKSSRKEHKERGKSESVKQEGEKYTSHVSPSAKEPKNRKGYQMSPTPAVKEKNALTSSVSLTNPKEKEKYRSSKSHDKVKVKTESVTQKSSAMSVKCDDSSQSNRLQHKPLDTRQSHTDLAPTVSPDKLKDTTAKTGERLANKVAKDSAASTELQDNDLARNVSKKSKKRSHPDKHQSPSSSRASKHAKKEAAGSCEKRMHATSDDRTETGTKKTHRAEQTAASRQISAAPSQTTKRDREDWCPPAQDAVSQRTKCAVGGEIKRQRVVVDGSRAHSSYLSPSAARDQPASSANRPAAVSMSPSSTSSSSCSSLEAESEQDEISQRDQPTVQDSEPGRGSHPLQRLMNEVFSGGSSDHSGQSRSPSPAARQSATVTAADHEPTSPPRRPSIFTTEYLAELQALQRRIMTSQSRHELTQVFHLIHATGQLEDTPNYYDFDLCALDQDVVRKLQQCLLMV